MKQAIPYLIFNGNALDALEYYKEVFEGEITDLQTFGEADYPTPPEAEDRIIHARFKKGDLLLMASDTFPGSEVQTGSNLSLVLEFESEEEIKEVYDRLSARSKIHMELQDTFWGAKYAKVKDPYGITWDLNYAR
ncbi:VOC family protein [Bacillus salacetis]|uniref:VOC family protein n=1 Tax=Bacillus salacetis TaxID=2315464 RepID=A0A3A1RAH8_9BACI|nr:VOC family protein [Bacillus salacetis]RIW38924.1 VOC family protein [Bacillus salacetis]